MADIAKLRSACAGTDYTAFLWDDGTVTLEGNPAFDASAVTRLRGVRQIAAAETGAIAVLLEDGSVRLIGKKKYALWQRAVDGWPSVRKIALNDDYLIGIGHDGHIQVLCAHDKGHASIIKQWTSIREIALYGTFAVGIHDDGTIVMTPYNPNAYWFDEAAQWENIAQIAIGTQTGIGGNGVYLAGLKNDGSVVCASKYPVFEHEVSSWTGIERLDSGFRNTLFALKQDGSLLAADCPQSIEKITGEKEVLWLTAGQRHVFLFRRDGSVAGYGDTACYSLKNEKPAHVETKMEAVMRVKGRNIKKSAAIGVLALSILIAALLLITDVLRLYIIVSFSGNYLCDLDVVLAVLLVIIGALCAALVWPRKPSGA